MFASLAGVDVTKLVDAKDSKTGKFCRLGG
jgi:hypothetical protein